MGDNDYEVESFRSSPVEAGVHLHSPIGAGSGSVGPGEHRPPIQSDDQGAVARLEERGIFGSSIANLGQSGRFAEQIAVMGLRGCSTMQ